MNKEGNYWVGQKVHLGFSIRWKTDGMGKWENKSRYHHTMVTEYAVFFSWHKRSRVRQSVLGSTLIPYVLLLYHPQHMAFFPHAPKMAAVSLGFTSAFQARRKGEGSWLLPIDLPILMRDTNFMEVPSNRLPLTFHWLELGHVATAGFRGVWKLSTLLLWTKSGIYTV